MFRLNFRIATKLGMAGGVALLTVGAIALNQSWDRQARAHLAAEADNADAVRVATLMAAVATRRVVIMGRDIRLAMSEPDVDDVLKRAGGFGAEGVKALETAAAAAATGHGRQRLEHAKEVTLKYTAAVGEVAAVRKEVLGLQARLSELGRSWSADMDALLASRELAALPNAAEVTHALERADFYSANGRVSVWAYFVRNTKDSAPRINSAIQNNIKFLKEARAMVSDRGIAAKIDAFLGFAPQYQETIEQILKSGDRMVAVVKDHADPLRIELDKLLDETASDLTAQAAEIQGRIDAQESRSRTIGLMLDAVVMVVLIGSIVFSYAGVSRPIARLNGAMEKMAKGDLDIEVPGAGRGDEIGDMAKTITVIRENAAAEAVRKQEEAKHEETARAGRRKANMQSLADKFETAVGAIVETVSSASTELEASADTLTKSAETTQQLTTIVAEASEEASANVQSVASATEQMSGSISEISRQVQESSRIAGDAVKQAEKTDARITALSEAAGRIGDVVKLITAIAEQTNLLALNATIEAARAGEAGKGFAVVAQEVKALASQTAKATDEIGTQIKGMQSATQESVSAIKEIGGTIGRISEIAATIAAAVEEQGAATKEIARNVQQAAQGTTQVATNITDVNRGAAETGAASSQVLTSAKSLASESNRLKLEMTKFLETVRAA
jgi:methyl-accepting chemotaxis protein